MSWLILEPSTIEYKQKAWRPEPACPVHLHNILPLASTSIKLQSGQILEPSSAKIHSFILLSVLRRVCSFFPSELSTECELVLPLSISILLFYHLHLGLTSGAYCIVHKVSPQRVCRCIALPSLNISASCGGWWTPTLGRLTPLEEPRYPLHTWGWVAPMTYLDGCGEEKKPSPHRDSIPGSSNP